MFSKTFGFLYVFVICEGFGRFEDFAGFEGFVSFGALVAGARWRGAGSWSGWRSGGPIPGCGSSAPAVAGRAAAAGAGSGCWSRPWKSSFLGRASFWARSSAETLA